MNDNNNTGNEGESKFDYEAWKSFQNMINPSYRLPEDNFATKMFNRVYDPCKPLPLTITETIKHSLEDL